MANESARTQRNRMQFGEVIRSCRLQAQLSQQQLAEMMYVDTSTISSWESGRGRPSLERLPVLCAILGVPLDVFFPMPEGTAQPSGLSREDQLSATLYRQLTPHDQAVIDIMLDRMLSGDEARLRRRCLTDFLTLFRNPAGMVTGKTLPLREGDTPEKVQVRRSAVTERAKELVYVGDESMVPLYYPGNQVFLAYTRHLHSGEVGIFAVNGEICIREYRVGYLRAKAPGFPDIPLREEDDILFFGTVLGTLDRSDLPDAREAAMLAKIAWDKEHG